MANRESLRDTIDAVLHALNSDDGEGRISGLERLTQGFQSTELDEKELQEAEGAIKDLQGALAERGHKVFADGRLGPATWRALQHVQNELADSGIKNGDSGTEPDPAPEQGFTKESGPSSAPAPGSESVADPEPEPGPGSETADGPPEGDPGPLARPVALSDQAVSSKDQDALGFQVYVESVVDFLLAEETVPPLALAINAPWGRGKTSFMRMIETELHERSGQTTTKVATTWFNPWKYSVPTQVWAAFVSTVIRCVRDHLSWPKRIQFVLRRFWLNLSRQLDFGLAIRGAFALVFVVLSVALAFTDWTPVLKAGLAEDDTLTALFESVFGTQTKGASVGLVGIVVRILVVLIAVIYLYVTVGEKLGLNLLSYLEETDFKNKIATLVQFEEEMKHLRKCTPDPKVLKIVVFIDDLDRCKKEVLGEMIEALQLVEVSSRCIFILGMDLNIVAHTIESSRPDLAQSVGESVTGMEHGSGYKFLEKVIQTRLSLPNYDSDDLRGLISVALQNGAQQEAGQREPKDRGRSIERHEPKTAEKSTPIPVQAWPIPKGIRRAAGAFQDLVTGRPEPPLKDDERVTQAAQYYGAIHFENPRRLKRFINAFRLYAYLAFGTGWDLDIHRLARFIVLAEKWPAALDFFLESPGNLEAWRASLFGTAWKAGTGLGAVQDSRQIALARLAQRGIPAENDEFANLIELVQGDGRIRKFTDKQFEAFAASPNPTGEADWFEYDDLKLLGERYGFCYFPGRMT